MPLPVTEGHPITSGVFEGFSWIRCEGKGSFLNSPLMKSFGEDRMEGGESLIVVDLEGCTGMDSTFMGTLAGIASRLAAVDGGMLQIACADERNRRSLEDLGLDFLMQINPPEPRWSDQLTEIRSRLQPVKLATRTDRARHVLQAHEVLSGISDKNAREFQNVVGTLQRQLEDKPQPEP